MNVLFNKGDGTFAPDDASNGDATTLALGDFNGDGSLDVVYCPGNTLWVMLNHGDGTFAAPVWYAVGSGGVVVVSLATGDFDGDGKLDIAAVDNLNGAVNVLRNMGGGVFGAAVSYPAGSRPNWVSVGDVNGDGKPDMAVANWGDGDVLVYLNQGGTFGTPAIYPVGMGSTPPRPGSVAIGDLDGDGKPDLAVALGAAFQIEVLFNQGSGAFGAPLMLSAPAGAGDVVLTDLDGDGRPDITTVGGGLQVWLNMGSRTFAAPLSFPTSGEEVVAADLNGDGKPDLALVQGSTHDVEVLVAECGATLPWCTGATTKCNGACVNLQTDAANCGACGHACGATMVCTNGACSSPPCTTGLSFGAPIGQPAVVPQALAVADLDGDGKLDVATASRTPASGSPSVDVLLGHGDGTLAAEVSYPLSSQASAIASGDLNGDAKPDLVVSVGGQVAVLLNKGNGTFAAEVDYLAASTSRGVVVADVNGDGKADLVVADFAGSVSVLLNDGHATFAAGVSYATPGLSPVGIAVGDLNGDGRPDIVVGNVDPQDSDVMVLLNQGNGAFGAGSAYAAGVAAGDVALGDLNGDGKLDIATANYNSGTAGVLLNQGNGTFAPVVAYGAGAAPTSIALGDLDGDGKLDIVVGGVGGSPLVALVNMGGGKFAAPASITTEGVPFVVATADMNGDGKRDIVVISGKTNDVDVVLNACH